MSESPRDIWRGILLVLLATAAFGWMDACSKTLAGRLDPVQILWVRYALSLPFVLLMAAPGGIVTTARSSRPWLQLARALLIVVEMTLVVAAYRTLPLADAHAIFAATPLMVTALSMPLLGETVGWRRWLAVAIGMLGVLVIVRPGLGVAQPGALLALLCAAMYAVYQIMTRIVGRTDSSRTTMLWQIAAGTLMLSLVGPWFWTAPTGVEWSLLLAIALLGLGGHWALVQALSMAPAVVLQPFSYAMLPWAALAGWLVFGDLPDLWTVIGALIVVGGGLYAAYRERVRAGLT